jgi:hypothetical protein
VAAWHTAAVFEGYQVVDPLDHAEKALVLGAEMNRRL